LLSGIVKFSIQLIDLLCLCPIFSLYRFRAYLFNFS